MPAECPNCQVTISLARSFFKTAWSRWPCEACGAVLAVDLPRRLILGVLFGGLLPVLATITFGLGIVEMILVAIVSIASGFYFLEKVIVVEHTGYACRHCGYDLRGQAEGEDRCPECGRSFDRGEIFHKLTPADIAERQRRSRRRKRIERGIILGAVLLVSGQVAGLLVLRYRKAPAAPPAATTSAASSPANGDDAATDESE